MAKISIIMGIYNCADTLSEVIDSILNQTYTDWQMIMCDDGSSDNTYKVANSYVAKYPKKFVLIKNECNQGLNYTLNHCLKYADGEFIARMDGDDISMPTRFEEELRAFKEHPDISIVSTQMLYFDENGVFGKSNNDGYVKKESFPKGTPFCHAPCMVKKEAFDAVKGYAVSKHLLRMEDYDLWTRMYEQGYKGYNIGKPLYKMRDDRNAVKRRKYKFRINEAYVIYKAVRNLKLQKKDYLYVLRPLVLGLVPTPLYVYLHKKRLGRKEFILK